MRWKTRPVFVGTLGLGGDHPIRIQSMTTSPTSDVFSTVDQILRLIDHGCDLVRVTVQGKKEAFACEQIKNLLLKKGKNIPLISDVHFYPEAALLSVDFVDKVRINPGNFAEKKDHFVSLSEIEEQFTPLIEKCKKGKKALRIGVNHGSLSPRILHTYGNTLYAMVMSAFEYADLCRKYNFHNFVFSMKASSPFLMIQAYRLLVKEMIKKDWNYPLHLGVTEAGSSEDGIIKSSIGIGSLLIDGIGDTLRFSLTNDPWQEIEPAKKLLNFCEVYKKQKKDPFDIPSPEEKKTSGNLFLHVKNKEHIPLDFLKPGDGILFDSSLKKELFPSIEEAKKKNLLLLAHQSSHPDFLPFFFLEEFSKIPEIPTSFALWIKKDTDLSLLDKIKNFLPKLFIVEPTTPHVHEGRKFFLDWMKKNNLSLPVIWHFEHPCLSKEDEKIAFSVEVGSLFCDFLGDGWMVLPKNLPLSLQILQGCHIRLSKTEFISCPGCGRTLYDLQGTSERIRSKMSHLPGVKIAIMGCIVNGPGEMADADFGFVGSAKGKVDLYVGKECVQKQIDENEADLALIDLIKSKGKWISPSKH